jgi:hypothetical protein
MTVAAFIVVVLCMTIVQGCSPGERPATATGSQTQVVPSAIQPTVNGTKEVGPAFLEVKEVALTKENLRLDYCVTNVFPHDIWVCTSISNYARDPRSSAETLIRDGTLQVGRRGNGR